MAAWPSTLSQPLLAGYSNEPATAFVRTNMEAGFARQRKMFSAVPYKFPAQWKFTQAQMVIFKDFYQNTINSGTDFFTMTIDIGDGLATYDVRFVEGYKADGSNGVGWFVSGQLEVLET